MSAGDEIRPDGRVITPETKKLRMATRALRLHLDELPVDYDLDAPPEHFLAALALMSTRQRYDCAESMIGAGFGGTVLGSLARSLFVDGLRWLWIGDQPSNLRATLGDLLEERNRLCKLFDQADVHCPILSRWLMPLPDVADLTGESMTWLSAQPLPGEATLLQEFLRRPVNPAIVPSTAALLDMSGLRGVALILAYAGHGNYLGLQNTLSDDGAIGHDLRADYEALFMQAAAAGVTATLLGTAAAVPHAWPSDVERGPFLEHAVELALEVAATAVPIHRLGTARRAPDQGTRPITTYQPSVLHPCAVLHADELLPDVNSIALVAAASEDYYELARSMPIDPWAMEQPALHIVLGYAAAHSNLEAVMATYDQPGSGVIAVFAGRMLLEEAARLLWRFADRDEAKFKARAKQFFDEYRAARTKTIRNLTGSGVPQRDAVRIFAEPENIVYLTPRDQVAKGRVPLPTISSMLRDMGEPFPEPGWLEVAYSLLSQTTHSTPVGLLHSARFRQGGWEGNTLSPEMLGLALDVACLGSAHLLGHASTLLTDLSLEASQYYDRLPRQALVVHDAARLVHGLD